MKRPRPIVRPPADLNKVGAEDDDGDSWKLTWVGLALAVVVCLAFS